MKDGVRAWGAGRRALLVAFAAGGLLVTAFAPLGWWPLAFVSLCLLFALWRGAPGRRTAALQGYAFGLGLNLAGVSWLYISLHDVGGMPAWLAAISVAGFSAYLAIYPALAGWFTAQFASAGTWRFCLFAAAAWTLGEWLKATVFTGFPWLNVAYSQVDNVALMGYAPLVGAHGVTLLVALASANALALFTERANRRLLTAGLGAFVAIAALGAGLAAREWSTPAGPPVTVALLQGNVEQKLKWREGEREKALDNYLELAKASRARLIVLPETALPMLAEFLPPEYLTSLARHASENRGDVVVGLVTRDFRNNGYDLYNSAVTLGSSPRQRYSKAHLVPFGEFVPPFFGWVYQWLNMPMSGFSRGDVRQAPLAVAGTRVAMNICYEDTFGDGIIGALPEAEVLVNITNVAWFGRSIAAAQHLQFSQLRAIETGRFMLRATNTGVTAIVDPRGRVVKELPQFVRGTLEGEFVPLRGSTPYVILGDLPAVVICLGLALGVILSRRP